MDKRLVGAGWQVVVCLRLVSTMERDPPKRAVVTVVGNKADLLEREDRLARCASSVPIQPTLRMRTAPQPAVVGGACL
jgi:hypothetical protein